jgi:tetratricopeptide (TPR) repeat protein
MVESLRAKPVPPVPDRPTATQACDEGRKLLAPGDGSPVDLDAAFLKFKEALERDPTYADAYASVAAVLMQVGTRGAADYEPEALEAAFEWAERGLAYEPQNYGCLYAKALALAHLGRADDAFNLGTYLMHTYGQRYETYSLLARACHLREVKEEAMNYAYQAVLTASEGFQRYKAERTMGDLYYEYEQWERALHMFERCIEDGAPDAHLLHLASICCARMKDYDRALEFSLRSQALDPLPEARDVEAEVRRILASRAEKERKAQLKTKP